MPGIWKRPLAIISQPWGRGLPAIPPSNRCSAYPTRLLLLLLLLLLLRLHPPLPLLPPFPRLQRLSLIDIRLLFASHDPSPFFGPSPPID